MMDERALRVTFILHRDMMLRFVLLACRGSGQRDAFSRSVFVGACTDTHPAMRLILFRYYCMDPDSTAAMPVFNLTAELKGGATAPAAPKGGTKKGKGGRGESGK